MTISRVKKQKIRRSLIGLFSLLTLMGLFAMTDLSGRLETASLDWRYRTYNRETPISKDVIVIDIDEISIKNLSPTYGRWPFPRRIYKELLEFLMLGEPKGVFFDILFTEEQIGTDDDFQLAEASEAIGRASHAMQLLPETTYEDEQLVALPVGFAEKFSIALAPNKGFASIPFKDFQIPNPALLQKTPHVHAVNVEKDSDGFLRRVPLVFEYKEKWYPSLTVGALLLSHPKGQLLTKDHQLILEDQGKEIWSLPINSQFEFPLHFYKHNPKMYSFASVLESAQKIQSGEVEDPSQLPVNPFDLTGKYILIGTSSTGLADLKATPIDESLPGVFLHATAISNALLNDKLKNWPAWSAGLISLLLMALCYGCVVWSENLFIKILLPLSGLGAYIFTSIYAFKSQSLHLPLALPFMFTLVSFLDGFIYMGFMEARKRKQLGGTLSKYLAPSVTQQLIENDINPSAEVGKSKLLSILFSDVRGFTTMSEKMPAEQVVYHLNEYLEKMTDIIFHHNGTLDKFIGDAVMAFWGAPLDDEQHAYNAVKASMDMKLALFELNKKWQNESKVEFAIGVGVNTGRVIVGNIGSEKKLDYTVIGDNVNLASRIEGLTKQYGVELLVGPQTFDLIKDRILCRPIDLVQVKGKEEAVRIYEPIAEMGAKTPDFLEKEKFVEQFTQAWQLYLDGHFTQAAETFQKVLNQNQQTDGPSRLYLDRCKALHINPPKTWSGVYVATSK